MQRFAKQVGAKHGTVNLLFNNAGIAFGGLFKDVSLDDMRRVFDVNDWGVVHGCKAFLSLMTRAEAGCVINVSSVYGLIALPMQSAYCASKFAVRGFSDALRQEVAYLGNKMQVACAFPAGVKTAIAQRAKVLLHARARTRKNVSLVLYLGGTGGHRYISRCEKR